MQPLAKPSLTMSIQQTIFLKRIKKQTPILPDCPGQAA